MHVGQLEPDQRIFLLEIWQYLTKKRMKEMEWGQAARFQPPRQLRKKSSLKYSNTLHRERVCSLLLSTPVCCLLLLSSPNPLLPFFFSYFSLSPLPSHSPSLSPPLLLCQAPSSLLWRWNRKCWFNNSWSEFCIHVTSSAARFLLVRRAKWNHIAPWDAFMNSNSYKF